MATKATSKMATNNQAVKGWFLTFPQTELTKEELLAECMAIREVDEYVIAQEKHQDGGLHLHAFIKFTGTGIRFQQLKFSKQGNYQKAKSWKAVQAYIKKDGDFITNIDTESAEKKKGKKNKELLTMDPIVAVEEGLIPALALKNLIVNQKIYKDLTTKTPKIIDRECYWIVGKPGIGKSYYVRVKYDLIYEKAQNKWWDGYAGEDVVLMDDFDCKVLSHYLKIWADNYRFNAEVKGGTIQPTYTKLIVTSNYLPCQLWNTAEENILREAIERRFKLKTILNYELVDYKY